MKKISSVIVIAVIVMAVFCGSTQAKIWKVSLDPINKGDFKQLQNANDSAAVMSGDTIHIMPSIGYYSGAIITKKMIIIGNGNFLTENTGQQVNTLPSWFLGTIRFNSGSEGSAIMGCKLEADTWVNASNISVMRNKTLAIIINSNSEKLSNIVIKQNYVVSYLSIVGANSYNVFIANNYVSQGISAGGICNGNYNGIIINNICHGLSGTNFIIKNNINITDPYTECNTLYSNNIGNSAQFGTANGNLSNVDMATVFEGTGGTESQWKLKAGSPAIGAGDGGVDCGIFGGPDPYILSDMPMIPSIYYLNTSSMPTNSIKVDAKVKSHK